jgi:hypothetical protein
MILLPIAIAHTLRIAIGHVIDFRSTDFFVCPLAIAFGNAFVWVES